MAVAPNDIAVELGRPAPDSTASAQWQSWIDEALYLIGKRLDITTLDASDVDYVVKHAVADHVRKPDDATQVDTSIDDARMSRRYSSGNGRVTILPEWWLLLDPNLADSASVGSTQLYGEPDAPAYDPWVGA